MSRMKRSKRRQLPVFGDFPSNNFDFETLDPKEKEIRLVCLDLNANNNRFIHLRAKHVKLKDNPIFTALSYTWGDETPTFPVRITSQTNRRGQIHVRQNLHNFLCQINIERDTRWYWIDQICINQQDSIEKSHQVFQMADVFSQAKHVTGWLGLPFDGSDDFMDFVFDKEFQYPYGFEGQIKRIQTRQTETLKHYKNQLIQFVNLSYWRRTWVVQEMVLASSFSIRIGTRVVPWANFDLALSCFYRAFSSADMKDVRHRIDIIRLRGEKLGLIEHWDDAALLVLDTECTDPRDYAYALVGLVSKIQRIEPDYTASSNSMTVLFDILRKEVEHQLLVSNVTLDMRRDEGLAGKSFCAPKTSTLLHLISIFEVTGVFFIWFEHLLRVDPLTFDKRAVRKFWHEELLKPMRLQRSALGSRLRLPRVVEYALVYMLTCKNRKVGNALMSILGKVEMQLRKTRTWVVYEKAEDRIY